MINLCYSILHIDDDSDISKARKPLVNKIKESLDGKIPYIDSKTYKISNNLELENYEKNNSKINIKVNLKYGELGCLASHNSSWEHFLNSEYDAVMVIEDDAIFLNDFAKKLDNIVKEIPEDFDVVSLYVHPAKTLRYTEKLHDIGLQEIVLGYQNQSTLAYIMSRNGAKKYVEFFKNGVDGPADLFLFDLSKQTKFYSISPKTSQLFYTTTLDSYGEVDRNNTTIQNTAYLVDGSAYMRLED